MSRLETIMSYRDKNLQMIPVVAGGKVPSLKNWTKEYSNDTAQLEEWFLGTDNNVGIVTGKPSNIVVIDVDVGDVDGRKSIALKEAEMNTFLPTTVTARTPSGGLHYFYRYPQSIDKIVGKVGILDGVDIRADGNQVVVYPSIGEFGAYTWINSPTDMSFASLPMNWVRFIANLPTEGVIRTARRPFRLPEVIPSGVRHSTLLSYACSLSAKGATFAEVSGSVKEVNLSHCKPPISDQKELENIVIWAYEKSSKPPSQGDLDGLPPWIAVNTNGRQIIDEPAFISWYREEKQLLCINGVFYDENGAITTASIKSDIQGLIGEYLETSLSAKVNSIFESLKNECYFVPPPLQRDTVSLANATIRVTPEEVEEIDDVFTLTKLPVEYRKNTPTPIWDKFLDDLLYENDQLTLQEFIGYCLIPSTLAQKAFFLIGKGGEGKSVVGEIMQAIFGNAMIQSELHKLQENRFIMAQLEHKLVFYDDDLQSEALDDTGIFKKIVTANIPMLVERKGEPHHEILPYARIFASGNKGIEACYDRSEGFYRRLLVVQCKPKEARVDDKLLSKKIIDRELEGIVEWAIEGLQRLMSNEWEFTVSQRSYDAMNFAEEESNSFLAFLRDGDAVEFGEEFSVSSRDLYLGYERWCSDNAIKPLAMRTVSNYMRENLDSLALRFDDKVDGNARGYFGIGIKIEVGNLGRFRVVTGGAE